MDGHKNVTKTWFIVNLSICTIEVCQICLGSVRLEVQVLGLKVNNLKESVISYAAVKWSSSGLDLADTYFVLFFILKIHSNSNKLFFTHKICSNLDFKMINNVEKERHKIYV